MAYMNDPREQAIDIDNHVIWEADNRIEERYQWGAMITDYCDLTPEEYMKNPIIEAIKEGQSGQSGQTPSGSLEDTIREVGDNIVTAVEGICDCTSEIVNDSTDTIVDAIYSAATMISGHVPSGSTDVEIIFYYTQANHLTDAASLTPGDFASGIVVIGSDRYFSYTLGDPTEENWNKYLNHEISEAELRELSSNDYYIAIPKAYKGKMTLNENGTVDITSNFHEVEDSQIFPNYILYKSVDPDYFNEDYENGETNVQIPFKITIAK